LGNNRNIQIPESLSHNLQVFCGNESFFVLRKGYLYAAGKNKFGELGFEHKLHVKKLRKLDLPKVEIFHTFNSCSIALTGKFNCYLPRKWRYLPLGKNKINHSTS
jgi:alpha-tubulin suppressor-like RCC1 family protein